MALLPDRIQARNRARLLGRSHCLEQRESESLSLGVPAISTSISGIPELIEDGVSGLLVPPHDVEALAAAIRRLAEDRELQIACGRNGRRKVEELFEMGNNARSLIRIYEAGGVL